MSAPITDDLASRLRAARRAHRARQELTDYSARALVMVAFAIPVSLLVVMGVLALAVLLMAGSGLAGLGSAVAAMWLAVHQVPLTLSGVTVGALPLLPTLILVLGATRMSASAASERDDPTELVAVFLAAIGGPVLVTALSVGVVMDGSSVLEIESPDPLVAFGYTVGLHALAAVAGIAWDRRRYLMTRWGIGAADRRGLRYGVIGVVALLATGSALVAVRLIMGWSTLTTLLDGGYDFDGMLGLTVISLLYLPNVIIGASAIIVGSDAHVGGASADLMSAHGGAVPPLPILAILPHGGLGPWGYVGLVVPLAIAMFIGLRCRDLDPLANVRSVVVAGAVAATIMVVASTLVGGDLGELGDVGVTVTTAGVFTLGWIVVVGLVVALIYGALPSTRAAREHVDFGDFDAFLDDADSDDADSDDAVGYTDEDSTDTAEHADNADHADDGEVDGTDDVEVDDTDLVPPRRFTEADH